MEFAIDPGTGTPIYLQLKDQIRYAISVGELRPGESLPSIRTLESELGLNRNTVRRAYLELQQEGTLVIRQGKAAAVAPRVARSRRKRPTDEAAELALRVIRDVESRGLDGVRFAAAFSQVALDHDARYPKCAFVECSQTQAEDLAAAAQAAWHRRVIPVDLTRLRNDGSLMPPSVKYALTTHWHVAELTRLLKPRHLVIHQVRLRVAPAFSDGIRRLKGSRIGLLLRDPESVAGYRGLLLKHLKGKRNVKVALLEEKDQALKLMQEVECLVYTAPCRPFARKHAPPGVVTLELLCEPLSEELARLKEEMFT